MRERERSEIEVRERRWNGKKEMSKRKSDSINSKIRFFSTGKREKKSSSQEEPEENQMSSLKKSNSSMHMFRDFLRQQFDLNHLDHHEDDL